MAEKKTAKKSNPSPSKKKGLTALEKHLCSLEAKERTLVVQDGDVSYEIHFRATLDLETRNGLMENVREMYFPAGSYDKNYGDTILEFILFQLYTGITFNNDVVQFDRFMCSDYFRYDVAFEQAYRTEDYCSIKEAVTETVNAMLLEREISIYRESFYKNFNELFDAIHSFVDNADGSLTKMVESMKSEDGASAKMLLEALQQLNAKDEKKIVTAVLDYQENKAKKQGVAVKPLRI